jgi:hypothetical protein
MQPEYPILVENYQKWLKDRTVLKERGDWIEITTPFLDRHNDYLQIYVRRNGEFFTLTDDAYTIHDLERSGCILDTEKRLALLGEVLNGFQVQRRGDELVTEATVEDFPLKKHNLVQAMLAVHDLFYLAQPFVKSLFFEDVQRWFDIKDVRYTPNIKLTGRSGFDYTYDFVIPKSRRRPERLISTVNNADRANAQKILTAWLDTRDSRPEDAHAIAFVNDQAKAPSSAFVSALNRYEIRPVLWSRREQAEELFVQ